MGSTKYDRGFSLLEYVSVLPVLCGIIFGAVDINNALQAYSVLREAVHSSLRCAYTTDGACVRASNDTRVRLYDYFLSDAPASSIYREVDYRGTYRYLDLPILQFNNFRAQVLNQVLFDVPRSNYSASVDLTGLSSQVRYSRLVANGPFISGSDPRNPTFEYDNGGNYPSSNHIQVDRAGNNTVSLGANVGGPSPWATLATITRSSQNLRAACYRAVPFNAPSSGIGTNFDETCNAGTAARVVIHPFGHSQGTESNSCARVEIDLEGQGAPDNLGGQVYRGSSSNQNFYPRGVISSHVRGSWEPRPEFTFHSDVSLQANTEYQLRFRIVRLNALPCENDPTSMCPCENGPLSWSLSNINTYEPQYQEVSTETSCDERVPLGAQYSQSSCTPSLLAQSLGHDFGDAPHRYPVSTVVRDASNPHEKIPLERSTSQFAPINNAFSEEHARAVLVSRGDIQPQFASAVALNTTGVGQNYTSPGTSCGTNYGVPERAGSDGYIRNSSSALALCPPALSPDVGSWVDLSDIQDVRWSETTRNLPQYSPVRWTFETCSTPPPPQSQFPSDLPQYARLLWDGPNPSGLYQPLYTGPESEGFPNIDPRDPVYIKAHDSNYSCDLIQVRSVTYDDDRADIPADSLFRGLHPNHDLCEWRSELRTEAERLQMPAQAFFVPASTYANERETDTNPSDSCVDWRLGTEQASSLVPVPNGPFAEGTTPSECLAQGVHCIARFHGFLGDGSSHTTYDKDMAAATGKAQLEAMLPWAKWNCEGPQCAKIELEAPEDANTLTVRGSVEVPMNLLLRRSVTLRYSGQEHFEGIFSNK